ncbi:MAG: hypothetical protein R3Y06_00830 [Faecalibacterium sp.]
MIPCKASCENYCEGCHKSCEKWTALQEKQRLERAQKKAYLQKYAELDRMTRHQYYTLNHAG